MPDTDNPVLGKEYITTTARIIGNKISIVVNVTYTVLTDKMIDEIVFALQRCKGLDVNTHTVITHDNVPRIPGLVG